MLARLLLVLVTGLALVALTVAAGMLGGLLAEAWVWGRSRRYAHPRHMAEQASDWRWQVLFYEAKARLDRQYPD